MEMHKDVNMVLNTNLGYLQRVESSRFVKHKVKIAPCTISPLWRMALYE
jgi:hypothetical protein